MYFGQGEDFKLTTELSEKVQYSRNQAIKNGLNDAAYVNKWSFSFKTKLSAFQVTKISFRMKGIRTFNAQPVKIPHFKSLLTRKQARWPHIFIAFL